LLIVLEYLVGKFHEYNFFILSGFPIKVRAPSDTILLGAKGASSPGTFEELSNAVVANNYRGIMIWYASVKNGLQYGATWDASEDKAAQEAYIKVMQKFKAA
jgi:hypothetical protein